MGLSAFRAGFSVLALGFFSTASTAAEWSEVTKIVSITAVEGVKVLRLQISPNVGTNPGACDPGTDFIDVRLDSRKSHSHDDRDAKADHRSDEDRDSEERRSEAHRQLLNAVQLAYLTGRNVRLYLREDRCSTVGTSLRLRVAAGVQVSN
jgi:hypothetical protein